jgi:hypothetical protein
VCVCVCVCVYGFPDFPKENSDSQVELFHSALF